MEILRIEEPEKNGYLLTCSEFEKFFSDEISGSKEASQKYLLKYLVNAPKLFVERKFFKSEEFTNFCETIKDDLKFRSVKINELRIDKITSRVKIKDGIKTTFWEMTIIDQNSRTHIFDYSTLEFPTQADAIAKFNTDHDLNLVYSE